MPLVNVNGIDLYYKLHGRGEPLVMIMGLGGGHGAWFFQVRAFKNRYRLITFDNRGIGKTDRPAESYTTGTMANDTIGLMDHLGIGEACMLGVSLGGMIAQEIAINHPRRVKKLVLACTTAGGGADGSAHSELMKAAGLGDGPAQADIRNVNIGKLMNSLNSLAFNRRLFRMVVLPLTKIYMNRIGTEGLTGQFEAAISHDTLDRLHLIEAPTLVIAGTGDRLIPPDSSRILASRIPNAELVMVDGGSHTFLAEMRSTFNREVLDFLGGD